MTAVSLSIKLSLRILWCHNRSTPYIPRFLLRCIRVGALLSLCVGPPLLLRRRVTLRRPRMGIGRHLAHLDRGLRGRVRVLRSERYRRAVGGSARGSRVEPRSLCSYRTAAETDREALVK